VTWTLQQQVLAPLLHVADCILIFLYLITILKEMNAGEKKVTTDLVSTRCDTGALKWRANGLSSRQLAGQLPLNTKTDNHN